MIRAKAKRSPATTASRGTCRAGFGDGIAGSSGMDAGSLGRTWFEMTAEVTLVALDGVSGENLAVRAGGAPEAGAGMLRLLGRLGSARAIHERTFSRAFAISAPRTSSR
jgi:hypothetical protein